MDPLLEEELGLIRVSVGIEVGLLLFNVDFELEVELDFRDFLAFLLGLTTMTPRASFCSLERRGGGGGERKYTSRSIRGGNLGLFSSSVAEGTHQMRMLELGLFVHHLKIRIREYINEKLNQLCTGNQSWEGRVFLRFLCVSF